MRLGFRCVNYVKRKPFRPHLLYETDGGLLYERFDMPKRASPVSGTFYKFYVRSGVYRSRSCDPCCKPVSFRAGNLTGEIAGRVRVSCRTGNLTDAFAGRDVRSRVANSKKISLERR